MRLTSLALAAVTTVTVFSVACTGTRRPATHSQWDGAADETGGAKGSGGAAVDGGTEDGGVGANNGDGGGGTAGTCDTALSYLGDDDHELVRLGLPVPTASFVWGFTGSSGRYIGNWFLTSSNHRDAFSQTIDPPRDGSMWARGVNGPGAGAGVVLWVQLVHPSNNAVNLSACSGLTFWARLATGSGEVTVALNDGSRPPGDLDNRSTLPVRSFSVGPAWQELTLPFSSFALGRASVATIEFFAGYTGEPVDLWIDDLALICASACPAAAASLD